MKPVFPLRLVPAFFACAFSAFQTALPAAEETHFATVDAHLEQGGVLYGFVDVEGDVDRIAKGVSELILALRETSPEMAMVPPVALDTIAAQAGLSAVQAVGLSSTKRNTGFHNRAFILTDGPPTGLLSLSGSENRAFDVLERAPKGADFVAEQQVNLEVLIDAARVLATNAMGPNGAAMVDGYLDQPIPDTPLTIRELMTAVNGRNYLIVDIDEDAVVEVPELGDVPEVHFLVRLESAAPIATKLSTLAQLQELPRFEAEIDGDFVTLRGFTEPNPLFDPVVFANGRTGELFLSSSEAFYTACVGSDGEKFAGDPAFAAATEGLSDTGVTLSYISPAVGEIIQQLLDQAMDQEPEAALMRPYMEWSFREIIADHPMASIARVETNGLYIASNWSVSHKQNLATAAYANPVTMGLMAAMAIPAFQKVRANSQEKAITNNLRQLASAADQYFLENGVTSVSTSELLGPNGYISNLNPVAGETYPEEISADQGTIEATLPDGTSVSIPF